MADPTLGNLLNAASGILLVALGAAVLAVRPRRRVNVALAGYAAFYGAAFVGLNLLPAGHPWGPGVALADTLLFTAAAGCLVFLALHFPSRAPREHLPLPALAGGATAVVLAWLFGLVAGEGVARGWEFAPRLTALAVFYGAVVFTATLLPLRYARTAPGDRPGRRLLALFNLAVAAFPNSISLEQAFADDASRFTAPVAVVVLLFVSAIWLAVGERARDPRPARAIVWAGLVLAFVGLLVGRAGLDEGTGYHGLARTLGVLVLAYAILRHQLLGIDVRLRWTIKRGTVAAIFLAAFAVTTAVAQEFLSAEYGFVYGGLAAGVLVFALAPLQRFAERVAEATLPGVRDSGARDRARGEDAYRSALALALADGVLTVEEERHLARLAGALGLSHERALELREEARSLAPAPPVP